MEKKRIEWEGYEGIEFTFDGRVARVIMPKVEPCGRWALKTEYFGAFPEAELELLSRGWHIAYNENDNRWAEDRDLIRKESFIRFVSAELGLDKKCALVGMSCGGLYAVKLAAKAPELVSAIYLDAPVINLLSCPFGLGVGTRELLSEYTECTGRTLVDMLSYREHPLDKLGMLTAQGIPVILVAGDSDTTVPYEENGHLVKEYYEKSGGTIEVYLKRGCAHHPHGLDDPRIIADFLARY